MTYSGYYRLNNFKNANYYSWLAKKQAWEEKQRKANTPYAKLVEQVKNDIKEGKKLHGIEKAIAENLALEALENK